MERWEFQVWVCRLPIPSQSTVGIGVWPALGSLLGVPNLRPRYSYPQPRRSPCVGCVTSASVGVTFTGLGVTCIGDDSPMLVI